MKQIRFPQFTHFLILPTFFLIYAIFLNLLPLQAAEGQNIIPNGSLELNASNPAFPQGWNKGGWGINQRSFTYPCAGDDGSQAAKVEITSYQSGDAKWYFQPVAVQSGEYQLSDTYNSNVQSYVTLQLQLTDGSYRYPDIAMLPSTNGTWQTVKKSFTLPANVQAVTVFHLIKSVGWLITDNYELIKSTPAPSNDIIPNASLETISAVDFSLPDQWLRGGWGSNTRAFSYPVPGFNSQRAAQVDISSYQTGDAKWFFKPLPLSPGVYQFSDNYRASTQSYVSVQIILQDNTAKYIDIAKPVVTAAWQEVKANFTVPSSAVSVTIFHLIKSVGSLTVDNYSLKNVTDSVNFAEGMVTLQFDDGYRTTFQNAIPILNQAGLKSSQAIVTGYFGFPGYVDQPMTVSMYTAGHEIASHTQRHVHLTQLSEDQKRDEIIGSREVLQSLGIQPVDIFVYPFGEYDASVQQLVRQAGYVGARGTARGFNTKQTNPYELVSQSIDLPTTLDQVKAWIDTARANKTWLILEIHNVDYTGTSYSTTPEILQGIVDYLKNRQVKVVTTAEGLALMK